MSGPDPQVVQIFREEADERIDRMVTTLLALEAGEAAPDAIDVLFRDAHSLKGNAGMVGFGEVQRIAHAIEDVLEDARSGGGLDPALAAPLLDATDAMRRGVAGETGLAEAALAALAPATGEALAHPDESEPQAAAPAPPAPDEQRSIRVAAHKVDRLLDAVGETVLQHRRLEHVLSSGGEEQPATEPVGEALGRGELLLDELQHSVIEMRTLPLKTIVGPYPRAVRDLAAEHGKEVELVITGAETQLDRLMLDGIAETIAHVLRNSVAHGIEPADERLAAGKGARGRVDLRAEQRGGMVAIEVSDDGRGVPREVIERAAGGSLAEVLAQPGFSTAESVTDVAGRGVGLDAVKAHVESLGGTIDVASEPGRGTSVTLTVPLTLAFLHVLLLERGGQAFGLPIASVTEAVPVTSTVSLGGRNSVEYRGETVPLGDLAAAIGASAPALRPRPPAVIVSAGGARAAIACDAVLGEEETLVKSLGPTLGRLPGYLGAAILGDGRIALIIDPSTLARRATGAAAGPAAPVAAAAAQGPAEASTVLVVDDQFTVRELQRSILEAAGYRVETARDGVEALGMIEANAEIALVVTDIQMPEMDGFELLRRVRAHPERSALPVVVVTSLAGDEDRRRGLEAGADAYIGKDDFDQQALLGTVERLVGR